MQTRFQGRAVANVTYVTLGLGYCLFYSSLLNFASVFTFLTSFSERFDGAFFIRALTYLTSRPRHCLFYSSLFNFYNLFLRTAEHVLGTRWPKKKMPLYSHRVGRPRRPLRPLLEEGPLPGDPPPPAVEEHPHCGQQGERCCDDGDLQKERNPFKP